VDQGTRKSATAAVAAICCAASAVVAGCSDVSTDPRAGALAGGVNALATGAYDRRLAEREATLRGLDQAENALAGRLASTNERLQSVEREIAKRKTALAKLQAEQKAIEKSIEKLRSRLALRSGVQRSVDQENDRRRAAMQPLEAQLAKLKAFTDELEQNGHQEAIALAGISTDTSAATAEGARSTTTLPAAATASPGSTGPGSTATAKLDTIARRSEQIGAEADVLIRRMKADLAQLDG
jgi:peptidoglycan hydrolase CwlO-like protein